MSEPTTIRFSNRKLIQWLETNGATEGCASHFLLEKGMGEYIELYFFKPDLIKLVLHPRLIERQRMIEPTDENNPNPDDFDLIRDVLPDGRTTEANLDVLDSLVLKGGDVE